MATNLYTSAYVSNPSSLFAEVEKEMERKKRWEKEIITLDIVFIGKKEELGEIRFQIHPSEYDEILNLQGTHCGYSFEENKKIVLKILPTDIFIITFSDYEVIKQDFEEKEKEREEIEATEKLIKEQKATIEKQNKFIEEELSKNKEEKLKKIPWYKRLGRKSNI